MSVQDADGVSAPELTDRFAELLAAASLARAILRREARGLAVWALIDRRNDAD